MVDSEEDLKEGSVSLKDVLEELLEVALALQEEYKDDTDYSEDVGFILSLSLMIIRKFLSML